MKSYLESLDPRPLKNLNEHLQNLINGRLWVKILIALALGLIVGTLLGPEFDLVREDRAKTIGNWLALPGHIFLGMIQMIVIPLVFTSIITGLSASENMEQLKKLGIRAVAFFVIFTVIAIGIGISLAYVIKPGEYLDMATIQVETEHTQTPQVEEPLETPSFGQVPSVIADVLPSNPLGSMVEKEMFQVVLFAIILGLAILAMNPNQSNVLLELLSSIQEVCMVVVRWAMVIAPLAVFGLIANTAIKTGIDALSGMAAYMGTVLLGLLLLLVLYLIVSKIATQTTFKSLLSSKREVQLLAFSTSSSAAVMPLSIQTAEDKLGVRSSIAQFLVPLGATINMSGTALYQGVATIFLAQVYQVELSIAALILIVVTTVGASIGSPATPGVGIIILAMVLNSAGIPVEGIALILGVDRILDMCRTAINVTGDLSACVVIDRWTN
ncbi:Proton/glutamate symporter [Candidatus Syntrophocurvum alkaliphilum]|uniref:Proton/glutamate symporter n=1 Tax=Candidatus Syntrophocurvum alkaliphilum TaxID=2293317 RepID=A0A6I6DLK9_9FIRM|nr:dicarboxylate/amino acid:cation symporter [Candidatus Syntrophocurvum alkaliphilum]QGU00277.1 Proton/glutamate symporter [Candidatus Syntrophocurvum alkaliphilum]